MMPRQLNTPVTFDRTTRRNQNAGKTSGRAGKVVPVSHFHLFAGDSAAGSAVVELSLAEMPRPLLNGVRLNVQAWAVPKSSHPQFGGFDDYMHARTGQDIKLLHGDRSPPPLYEVLTGADVTQAAASDLFKSLGLHVPAGAEINTDLIDAFSLIYNFRLAAHSSKLQRRAYASEDLTEALSLPRAFWPASSLTRIVPDYERALITGPVAMDVLAGQLPIDGIGRESSQAYSSNVTVWQDAGAAVTYGQAAKGSNVWLRTANGANPYMDVFAEMAGQTMVAQLADFDAAKKTQAFARMRALRAGNDATGFDNDDSILAMLMSGLRVPEEYFKRPILIDSAIVPVGFAERFATDAANLDASVTEGRAQAVLRLNVPPMPCEATVIVTVELVPDQITEAQSDEYLLATSLADLPDALRDVQRAEPVDMVFNREIDARHATPDGLYGYRPMNDRWNVETTRLGGVFYQANPLAPVYDQRQALWLSGIVNPGFTSDHWLVPDDLPHDVFSLNGPDDPAFEAVVRHDVSISGLTQIGDPLHENNDDMSVIADSIVAQL